MEHLTKEKVMDLTGDDLVTYINQMLSSGYSLSALSEEIGFRRQTIRDRLKRDGYFYNKECNAYIRPLIDEPLISKQTQPPKMPHKTKKEGGATIKLEEILKRVESLEIRLNAIQNNENNPSNEFKPMIFDSEVQARNYPLHKEVVDLIKQVSQANPYLKVKDIVNHALYIGLSQALHSENIE